MEALVDLWPVHIIVALCPYAMASPRCFHVYMRNSPCLRSDLGCKSRLRFSIAAKFLLRAQIQEQVTRLWKPRPCYSKSHWILKKKYPWMKLQIHSHILNLLAKGITDFFLPVPSFCPWRKVGESAFVAVLVTELLTQQNSSSPNRPTYYLCFLLITSLIWHNTKVLVPSLENCQWTAIFVP